jgi:hypothetical protein
MLLLLRSAFTERILGYELQVRVLGIPRATATGQPYYPLYELAPYRLLTVAAGSFIAYIWTVFPVPITEGSILRRDLGKSLFLLAKYLSAVTVTVDQRIQNEEGDLRIKSSPGRQLQKMREQLLDQQIALINSMRQNLIDMDWEPPFGGDFPKKTYVAIIDEIQESVSHHYYATIPRSAPLTYHLASSNTSRLLLMPARHSPEHTQVHLAGYRLSPPLASARSINLTK